MKEKEHKLLTIFNTGSPTLVLAHQLYYRLSFPHNQPNLEVRVAKLQRKTIKKLLTGCIVGGGRRGKKETALVSVKLKFLGALMTRNSNWLVLMRDDVICHSLALSFLSFPAHNTTSQQFLNGFAARTSKLDKL